MRAAKERSLDLAVPFLDELPSVGLRLFELVGKFYDLEAKGFFFLNHVLIFPDLELQLLLQALKVPALGERLSAGALFELTELAVVTESKRIIFFKSLLQLGFEPFELLVFFAKSVPERVVFPLEMLDEFLLLGGGGSLVSLGLGRKYFCLQALLVQDLKLSILLLDDGFDALSFLF